MRGTPPRVAPLDAPVVREARRTLARYDRAGRADRARVFGTCAGAPFADVQALLEWHDLMLFVVAHPASRGEHLRAERELARVATVARELALRGRVRDRRALEETGVAWSTVRASYGLAIARWWVERHPGRARLDGFDDNALPLAEALAAGLPAMAAEAAASLDAESAGATLGGSPDALAFVVRALDRIRAPAVVRETLFERMGAAIVVDLGASDASRTVLRCGEDAPWVVDRLQREVDAHAEIKAPLPRAPRLGLAARERYVDAGRATLAVLGRETDALSCTSARDTVVHPLGRGLAIALHAPAAGRRGPLDTHVGFVLWRNGVAVAYGGGWPFAGGCRIGVNVFPAFRGGESAWLFTQVLRAYRARFAVRRFVVEPYQYGLGNREGLASGAFWFYWRLGFRPVDPRVLALANDEAARRAADPAHRTGIDLLRRFTRSDIALDLEPGATPPEPLDLALRASAWLARHGRGDLGRAERTALARAERALGKRAPLSGPVRDAWIGWAPLVALIDELPSWPARDRSRLAAIVAAKARDEFAFQRGVAGHARLLRALARIAAARID